MNLSDRFHEILAGAEENPEANASAAALVLSAPVTPESTGLLALMYHEGIGVDINLDKCCELAEKAAFDGHDGLGYFLLGYMCDNAETPDQAEGGPRQRYDHYDAERFYEICSTIDSRWSVPAHRWLGDHFMDMARGGDPEEAVEHYEAIGELDGEAACRLSDYYWDMLGVDPAIPEEFRTEDLEEKVYRWTLLAVEHNPHDYSYRMGWCHAEGIGCRRAFRLARKYWEDAYGFGDWRAAREIADLYKDRLDNLPDNASDDERRKCEREIASWRRLASKTRERQLREGLAPLEDD